MKQNKLSTYISLNGNIVKYNEAAVDFANHNMHYSNSVFEGIRVYDGKIFQLEEHVDRLINSANLMKLDLSFDKKQITEFIIDLATKSNFKNAYIRPLAYKDMNDSDHVTIRVRDFNKAKCNLVILIFDSNPKLIDKPSINIIKTNYQKISGNILPKDSKASAKYAQVSLALNDLYRNNMNSKIQYDDCLFIDCSGYISECSTSNIFFGKGNNLYTPKSVSCLNGITRQTIIKIANDLNYSTVEENITLDDIDKFDYCFTTGTSSEITKVNIINIGDFNDKNHIKRFDLDSSCHHIDEIIEKFIFLSGKIT